MSLAEIINNKTTLTLEELKNNKQLVVEIQIKLRNLGLYPGGQWIDGKLGGDNSRSRKGLNQFCNALNLELPSVQNAINPALAQALLETQQIDSIFSKASNQSEVLDKLASIQRDTPISSSGPYAYLDRSIKNSPFEFDVQSYPTHLAQQPDGVEIISYGKTFNLANTDQIVTFNDYPLLGVRPSIDESNLNFLNSGITRACVCIGSFVPGDDEIKGHWLGRGSLVKSQFLSSTKFIGILNAICKLHKVHQTCDVDNCVIGYGPNNKRYSFSSLVEDIHTYAGKIGASNSIAAMFKQFSTRRELENWIKSISGNTDIEFRGYYGSAFPPLISNPILFDTTLTGDQVVLRAESEVRSGNNHVSAYDLVRLITMLGWHLHLPQAARLPAAQWISLESLVRGMGVDTARYVDVALETLGLINIVDKPVVISKLGLGNSAMTYVALVKLVDKRKNPYMLRTLAMALWANTGGNITRDNNLAAGVTEIMRRVFAEELA